MRLQDFTSSKAGIRIGLAIGRYAPPRIGYGIARLAASVVVRRKPELYWTLRSNLLQVIGPEADTRGVHDLTQRVLTHAGRTYYDFFRMIGLSSEEIVRSVKLSDWLLEELASARARGQGILLLGVHTSNFNLPIVALGVRGFPILVLSLAGTGPGYILVDRLRAMRGIESIPVTPESLRDAIRRLREGGIVVTGADWPVPSDDELVEFFGRPAYLPLGPARLARMTGARVILGSCHYDPDQGYILDVTGPIEMARTQSRREDVLTNTRRLAEVMERYVRAHVEQWAMFHRVWPDTPGG